MVPDAYKKIDSLYNFKKAVKNGSLKTAHAECEAFVKHIRFCEIA